WSFAGRTGAERTPCPWLTVRRSCCAGTCCSSRRHPAGEPASTLPHLFFTTVGDASSRRGGAAGTLPSSVAASPEGSHALLNGSLPALSLPAGEMLSCKPRE